MTSQKIRKHFLDFFSSKSHYILPSAPIVVMHDPTLMFVNAGMNTLKDYFIGKKKVLFAKIASVQKCLRVSGRHNDLEDVGKDSYHHTMFEMLGNWHFGYCLKKQAIEWSWELLTAVYNIPIDNIYVTIFSGDAKAGLSIDEESQFYWENLLKKERIIHCGKKYNLWEMSSIGPCGPCSEIHIDIRSHKEKKNKYGKELINKDQPQVIELWNLVFMEFFRQFNGSIEILSESNIDTGLGFERICRILQNKVSNYDTDIFSSFIRKVEELSYTIYGRSPNSDIAIRVIVDHIRSITFAIADGQNPCNAGAGYVIRRILRRAVSFCYRLKKEAFLSNLVDILVKEMSIHFTELIYQKKGIKEKIYREEIYFFNTFHKGLKRLEHIIQETKGKKQKSIYGIKIFELYDTYGFPMDLSRLLATENALVIDEVGFEKELNIQKNRSRIARPFQTEDWIIIKETKFHRADFVGYDKLSFYVHISKYRRIKKDINISYQIVFSITQFYAEDSEQVGDKGVIENEKEIISIIETKKENSIILHIANSIPLSPEKVFRATIDKFRRNSIEKNHSATHLLHYALMIILNDVTKKGSCVRQELLRFDFSYTKKLTKNHIQNIEGFVQEIIYQDLPIKERISLFNSLDKVAMSEKVRSIRFGPTVELCQGFHVKRTRDIGRFKIISESYVGSGIHRIEAITSKFAINYLNNIQDIYQIIIEEMNRHCSPIKYLQIMQQNNKSYQSKIEALILKEIQRIKTNCLVKAKFHNNYILFCEKTNLDIRGFKTIALALRRQNTEIIIIIISVLEALICIAISDKLRDIYDMNAFKILKKVSPTIYCENANKVVTFAKVKNIRGLTEALKLVFSWYETYFYL